MMDADLGNITAACPFLPALPDASGRAAQTKTAGRSELTRDAAQDYLSTALRLFSSQTYSIIFQPASRL